MPEIPAPNDHTRPKSQPLVSLLLRGGSPGDELYLKLAEFPGGTSSHLSFTAVI
jgi:hypothetical protein